jgi:hypothetical protein
MLARGVPMPGGTWPRSHASESLATHAFQQRRTRSDCLICRARGDTDRLSPRRDKYAEVYKPPAPQPIQVTHTPSPSAARPSHDQSRGLSRRRRQAQVNQT